MKGNHCGAARHEVGDYGCAYIGTTAAAVLEQELRDLAEARQMGAIDDGATSPLSLHQACAYEHGVRSGKKAEADALEILDRAAPLPTVPSRTKSTQMSSSVGQWRWKSSRKVGQSSFRSCHRPSGGRLVLLQFVSW
jgi:hypothetical protein